MSRSRTSQALGLQPGEYDQRVTIEPYGGGERHQNKQQQADITHRVRMRSDSQSRTITPRDWLLLADGTRLDIERVYDVDLRKVELAIECKEVVA